MREVFYFAVLGLAVSICSAACLGSKCSKLGSDEISDDHVNLLQKKAAVSAKQTSFDLDDSEMYSLDCVMRVDVVSKKIILSTKEGEMFVTPAGIVHNGQNIGNAPPKAQICMSKDTNATAGAMAFFAQTTTSDFLFHEQSNWDRFVNQHCYAKKHQKNMFLWIGAVSHEASRMLDQKDADAMPCGESGTPSNHYFRALALRAILEKYRDIRLIVNIDLDVIFTAKHFDEDVEATFFEDSQADIFAGAKAPRGDEWALVQLVNAAILGFKNTAFSRNFLANWFKHRCGFKDQHSLWYNLLKVFQEENQHFKWDPTKMLTYREASDYVPRLVGEYFPEFKAYAESGHLYEAIHFPHLVLYPNAGSDVMRFPENSSHFIHSKQSAWLSAESSRPDQRTC